MGNKRSFHFQEKEKKSHHRETPNSHSNSHINQLKFFLWHRSATRSYGKHTIRTILQHKSTQQNQLNQFNPTKQASTSQQHKNKNKKTNKTPVCFHRKMGLPLSPKQKQSKQQTKRKENMKTISTGSRSEWFGSWSISAIKWRSVASRPVLRVLQRAWRMYSTDSLELEFTSRGKWPQTVCSMLALYSLPLQRSTMMDCGLKGKSKTTPFGRLNICVKKHFSHLFSFSQIKNMVEYTWGEKEI